MLKLTFGALAVTLLSWTSAASADIYRCYYEVSGTTNASTTLYFQIRVGVSVCDTTGPLTMPNGTNEFAATDSILAGWRKIGGGGGSCNTLCADISPDTFEINADDDFTVWVSQNGISYSQLNPSVTINGLTITNTSCAIPTLTEWGTIVLSALTVAVGGAFLMRRRRLNAPA